MGDEAEGDAVGNVICERHHGDRHKGWNGHSRVAPVDIFDSAHHENAYIDEGRCCSIGRYELCDRRQEHGYKEQYSC